MSVAHLGLQEFATVVAIGSGRLKAGTIGELAETAAMMSRSNSAAYSANYGDYAEPVSAENIEAEALRLLAADDLMGHFGPIVYNCVTNGGTFYYGDLPADATQTTIGNEVAAWRKLEDDCRKWQDGMSRQAKRAEDNAVAFNDVGQLPRLSAEQLRALMGDGALIVATFRVDESESQSDYFGGRTARQVVIGIRKSKRESFAALRKAAAAFPPTADFGPGKDTYTARVVQTSENYQWNGAWYSKGSNSHWHNDEGHGSKFTTRQAAEKFIEAAGPPHALTSDGQQITFGWEIGCESIEHRENYSMGGGNYLGHDRYGGWQVKSQQYISGPMEVWKL